MGAIQDQSQPRQSSSSSDNFSYRIIDTGIIVTVPNNQEMILFQEIQLKGELYLVGNAETVIV